MGPALVPPPTPRASARFPRRAWLRGAPAAVAAFLAACLAPARARAQDRVHALRVSGRRYAFSPAALDVQQDELVRVAFTAEDVPHSFALDEYRIAKRAGAGQTVTFEFRADRPGTFTYYCNLKSDAGCRDMRGTLVVHRR